MTAARPRWVPWAFAAKTTVSALLSLLVAFRFNLDQPQWALLTVLIVAQPQSDGLMLAKSFWRIVGTVMGAGVALLFVGLFAQELVLFLGALALWIGLCTFGSQYARNWAGYGFVLSGYTVAIVGIAGALQPSHAFFIATARVTEISLGIIVSACVGYLILPQRVSFSLLQAISAARVDLANATLAVLGNKDSQSLLTKLLAQAVACENLAAAAVFEDAALRRGLGHIRRFNLLLIRAASLLKLLGAPPDGLMRNCSGMGKAVARAERVVAEWRDAPSGPAAFAVRLEAAASGLPTPQQIYQHAAPDTDTVAIGVAFVLNLKELFAILIDVATVHDALLQNPGQTAPKVPFARSNDALSAALTGLRAALAVAIVASFWIVTAWPKGSTAAILAAVATARLATMGRAVPIARASALIFSLAAVPAFIVVEVFLPLASDFLMFALIVAPCIFCCALLIANPRMVLIGFMSGLLFASVGLFQNRMAYDPLGLINISIAAVLAAVVAMVLWAVIAPETAAAARRRFDRVVRRLLARVTAPGSNIGSARADAELGEALDQLRAHLQLDIPADMAVFEAGLALVGAGRALIRVGQQPRTVAASSGPELQLPRFDARRLGNWHQAVRRATDLIIAESLADLAARPRVRQGDDVVAVRLTNAFNLRQALEAVRVVSVGNPDAEVRHA